jgi:hypothetical protein
MMDTEKLKKVACDAIDKVAEELNDVSQEIWKHPELYWEEKRAHQVSEHYIKDTQNVCHCFFIPFFCWYIALELTQCVYILRM